MAKMSNLIKIFVSKWIRMGGYHWCLVLSEVKYVLLVKSWSEANVSEQQNGWVFHLSHSPLPPLSSSFLLVSLISLAPPDANFFLFKKTDLWHQRRDFHQKYHVKVTIGRGLPILSKTYYRPSQPQPSEPEPQLDAPMEMNGLG